MNKILTSLMAIATLGGCVQTDEQGQAKPIPRSQVVVDQRLTEELQHVAYKDPVADVNLAVARHDFYLIALENDQQSLPGITAVEMDLNQIQQQCGLRFIAQEGSKIDSDKFVLVKQYATKFNRLMWQICQGSGQ